jgi:hypothetical protein
MLKPVFLHFSIGSITDLMAKLIFLTLQKNIKIYPHTNMFFDKYSIHDQPN